MHAYSPPLFFRRKLMTTTTIKSSELCKIFGEPESYGQQEHSAHWAQAKDSMQRCLETRGMGNAPLEYFLKHAVVDLKEWITSKETLDVCDRCASLAANFFVKDIPRDVPRIESAIKICEGSPLGLFAKDQLLKRLVTFYLSNDEIDKAEIEAAKIEQSDIKCFVYQKIYRERIKRFGIDSAISSAEIKIGERDKEALTVALLIIVHHLLKSGSVQDAAIFIEGLLTAGLLGEFEIKTVLESALQKSLEAGDVEYVDYYVSKMELSSSEAFLRVIVSRLECPQDANQIVGLFSSYIDEVDTLASESRLDKQFIQMLIQAFSELEDIEALEGLFEKIEEQDQKFAVKIAILGILRKRKETGAVVRVALQASTLDIAPIKRVKTLRGCIFSSLLNNDLKSAVSLFKTIEELRGKASVFDLDCLEDQEEFIALSRSYLFLAYRLETGCEGYLVLAEALSEMVENPKVELPEDLKAEISEILDEQVVSQFSSLNVN